MNIWGLTTVYSILSFKLFKWQYYSLVFFNLVCASIYFVTSLKPTNYQRLSEAIKLSHGLITKHSYYNINVITKCIKMILGYFMICGILKFPSDYTPAQLIYGELSKAWMYILNHYNHRQLLIHGIFFSHALIFWSASILTALVDFCYPKDIKIYKVQDEKHIPLKTWLKCTPLIVFNEALAYVLVNYTYDAYNTFNYDGFSPIVPDMLTTVFSLATFGFISEFWFYMTHRLMHKSNFLWKYVHSVHHQIKAPSVFFSLYTHPIEYTIGNFVSLALGPLILGSHFLIWFIWVILSTIDFCAGHSGWHLPFWQSPEFHDYHHREETDNFGTGLKIFDNLFGTVGDYPEDLDKVYTTPDYSIDKVLKGL